VSSLKPKFLYQLAVSFLYSLAPVIVFPYISRVLGPENIGKINFIDYTAQFFILFASFGIPLYGAREIAKVRTQPEKLKKLTTELLFIHMGISLLSLIAFVLFALLRQQFFSERQLFLLGGLNILINAFTLDWLIQGMEDFAFFGKRSYLVKIISITLIFLLIRNADDYVLYYLLLIGTNMLITLADLVYLFRKKIFISRSIQPGLHLIPLSVFFLTTATMSLYTYFDTIILGVVSGTLAVGFYTTGLKTIRLTQNFVNDLGGVLLPRMSYFIQMNDRVAIDRIISRSLYYVVTVSVPLGIFFYLMAPEVILVLAGKRFTSSIIIVQILSVLPLIIGLSNVFGIQILLPYGKEKNVLVAVLAGSIFSVGLNIILCRLYAETGAAIACVVAEAIITVLMGLQAFKLLPFSIASKIVIGIVCCGLLFIPVVFLCRLNIDNLIWRIALAGMLCLAIYSALQLFVFSNVVLKEIINFFYYRIFKRKIFVV
jgi:O-antigen/teichoic acid export membrane protein